MKLVVADPPEAGWVALNERPTGEQQAVANLLAGEEPGCDCEQACDACVFEAIRYG